MVEIGPLVVKPYGAIIALAILVGGGVIYWKAKKQGQKVNDFADVFLWTLVGGLFGARAYHVVHQWSFYSSQPKLIFNLWQGGLAIYGALFGGILSLWFFTKIKNFDFLSWLDLFALGLPLAQAIGRWANFFNHEIYGSPTNLPWGIYIPPAFCLPEFKAFAFFHPLFLYESVWSLLVFALVLAASQKLPKKLLPGELFCLYLSLYSIGRFLIEFLRPDSWRLFGLPVAQMIAVAVVVFCAGATLLRRGRKKHRMRKAKKRLEKTEALILVSLKALLGGIVFIFLGLKFLEEKEVRFG